jgi:hypothetical protein
MSSPTHCGLNSTLAATLRGLVFGFRRIRDPTMLVPFATYAL